MYVLMIFFFFFSSRRRHTRSLRDWSSDVCSSDLTAISLDHEWDALRFQPLAEVPENAIPAADMLPVGRQATFAFRAVRLARSEERRVGKECRSRWSP